MLCRKMRSINPGDVEDYFPQYLRHLILELLGDAGNGAAAEGEGAASCNDAQVIQDICLKVERDLADLRCVLSMA